MADARKLRSVTAELKPVMTDAPPRPRRGYSNRQEATLDPDRQWLEVTCEECGTRVVLQAPDPALNQRAEQVTEAVRLSDGSETAVTVVMARPSATLRYECPGCNEPPEDGAGLAAGVGVEDQPRPVIREATL